MGTCPTKRLSRYQWKEVRQFVCFTRAIEIKVIRSKTEEEVDITQVGVLNLNSHPSLFVRGGVFYV
jgi:hypothetical protein